VRRAPRVSVIPAVLLLVALGGTAARAQQRPVGPMVRFLGTLPPADQERLVADSTAARLVAVTRDADGTPVANVVVRLRGGDATALARLGARVGTRAGGLVNARVPLSSLGPLLADPSVAAVYGTRRWPAFDRARATIDAGATNDVATADIGVASLRRMLGPDRFTGSVGRGVIVGLVDTGIDFTHPDFLVDSLGRSRVLFLWDQTLPGPGPGVVGATSFGYGTECVQATLTAAGCASRDSIGHGTHVLGTAAGDGSATGNGQPAGEFAGVAPGADLIVVKSTFLSGDVVDGVNYIFSRAAQLGRPAVVNLSLGAQWGPHDGTLPEELELDSLVGPGRIVVAAVGNAGDNGNASPAVATDDLHATATLAAGQGVTFSLTVPSYQPAAGNSNDFIVLQLWYAGSDTLTVTVVRPDGTTLVAAPGATVTADDPDGWVHVENGPGTSVALTRDNLGFIVIGDLGTVAHPPAPGTWTIQVSSQVSASGKPVHLWVAEAALGARASAQGVSLGSGASNRYLVATPATAGRVLAVGAYVTRLRWRDVNGEPEQYSNRELLGDLAWFSGPGPRRDGVQKPDLAAPGQGVASALSGTASVPAGRVMQDGRHWILEGTSMAAPFVTGAVALLLERDARLTPEAARALLAGAARIDSFAWHPYDGRADGAPNASWGYGKLSVPAALEALSSSMLGPGGTINISENPVRGSLVVIHVSSPAVRAGVYTFDGSLVRDLGAAPAGRLQWDLTAADGRQVVNGVYLLVVDLGGTILRHRIYVARRGP
jgi:subtilisin family serine protease